MPAALARVAVSELRPSSDVSTLSPLSASLRPTAAPIAPGATTATTGLMNSSIPAQDEDDSSLRIASASPVRERRSKPSVRTPYGGEKCEYSPPRAQNYRLHDLMECAIVAPWPPPVLSRHQHAGPPSSCDDPPMGVGVGN